MELALAGGEGCGSWRAVESPMGGGARGQGARRAGWRVAGRRRRCSAMGLGGEAGRERGLLYILRKVDKLFIFKAHLIQLATTDYSTFSLNMFNIFLNHVQHLTFEMLKLYR